jgi:protein-disulfide isomerase
MKLTRRVPDRELSDADAEDYGVYDHENPFVLEGYKEYACPGCDSVSREYTGGDKEWTILPHLQPTPAQEKAIDFVIQMFPCLRGYQAHSRLQAQAFLREHLDKAKEEYRQVRDMLHEAHLGYDYHSYDELDLVPSDLEFWGAD